MNDFGYGINVPGKDIVYRQDVEDMLHNALPSRGMWEIEGDAIKNVICETVAYLMMDLEKLPWKGKTGTFTATNAIINTSMFTFKDNPHTKILCKEKEKI